MYLPLETKITILKENGWVLVRRGELEEMWVKTLSILSSVTIIGIVHFRELGIGSRETESREEFDMWTLL